MSVEGYYELQLTCNTRGCGTREDFIAPTRFEAVEKARTAGWMVSRFRTCYCPACAAIRRAS